MSLKKWIGRKLEDWLESGGGNVSALLKETNAATLARGELCLRNVELNRARVADALSLPPVAAGGRLRVRGAFCKSLRLKVPSWYSASKLSKRRASVSVSEFVLELEEVSPLECADGGSPAPPPAASPDTALTVAVRCGALWTSERIVVRLHLLPHPHPRDEATSSSSVLLLELSGLRSAPSPIDGGAERRPDPPPVGA